MTTQPEALRLADELESEFATLYEMQAAAELRRLHDIECSYLAEREIIKLIGEEAPKLHDRIAALENTRLYYEDRVRSLEYALGMALEALETAAMFTPSKSANGQSLNAALATARQTLNK